MLIPRRCSRWMPRAHPQTWGVSKVPSAAQHGPGSPHRCRCRCRRWQTGGNSVRQPHDARAATLPAVAVALLDHPLEVTVQVSSGPAAAASAGCRAGFRAPHRRSMHMPPVDTVVPFPCLQQLAAVVEASACAHPRFVPHRVAIQVWLPLPPPPPAAAVLPCCVGHVWRRAGAFMPPPGYRLATA